MADQSALIAGLSTRLDRLEARNAELERENTQLRERVVVLEHRLQNMARRQFGRLSETIPESGQLRMDLGEVVSPALADQVAQNDDDDDPPPGGGGTKRKERKRRGGRMQLPEHLPVEERPLDLPPEERIDDQGRPLQVLETRTTDKLDYRPGYFRVLRYQVPVYGRSWDPETPRRSPRVPGIIAGGLPSDDLVAHVLVAKYTDHLPHYRQEEQFARLAMPISRATIGNWSAAAATALAPIHEAIGAAVLAQSHLHMDDTTIRVLQPGRGKTHLGRMWIYSHGCDAYYQYTRTRAGRWCRERLAGFQGSVICDDYRGHDQLFSLGEAIEVNCWAHARRKFYDSGDSAYAPGILNLIGQLYGIESDLAERPPDGRRDERRRRSRPILDHLHRHLESLLADTTPRSGIGLAVRYALRLWNGLTAYVDDGRLPMDNNDAERGMRRVAMQRKNSLFVASHKHGGHAATCFSIIESCRRANLNPQEYLVQTFDQLQQGRTDYDAMRPAAVAATQHHNAA